MHKSFICPPGLCRQCKETGSPNIYSERDMGLSLAEVKHFNRSILILACGADVWIPAVTTTESWKLVRYHHPAWFKTQPGDSLPSPPKPITPTPVITNRETEAKKSTIQLLQTSVRRRWIALSAGLFLSECKGRLDKLLRWRCLLWEELIPA